MNNSLYLPILVLLVAGVAFALTPLLLAWIWATRYSPHKPGPSKNSVYECGLESEGDAWIQFKPGYYLYAIIFLVFDVEAVFLLPFAVAFTSFSIAESISGVPSTNGNWKCEVATLLWSFFIACKRFCHTAW